MLVTILGCMIFFISVLQIRFPNLAGALKESEPVMWKTVGSPSGFSFSDLGNTLSLYSWVLSRKFLGSDSSRVLREGERAFIKARRIQYRLILGLAFSFVGLVMSLVQSFV
ncbi:hypothetical protein PVT68_05335 [Microbulbifer bruguierae]|uniref:ABC transporter permease n=1 Tax=Microbulbifer bruguierae TaxID=3029061 RepID=A0ABY8NJE5_9GAMM|nr:hypothetical protein [Microbulbifer bruguierae]WGL17718.1 hypothetical protein PVT68_05335 [Microbulbifer bruguierae]